MNAAVDNKLSPAAVIVRRTIAASAEDLFDAWLDTEALVAWMRPGSIRRTEARVEPRVGGEYEILMHADSGVIPHRGVYRIIDRPRRLAFTWNSKFAENTLVTVDFLTRGAHTEVVITHEQLADEERDSHNRGWTSALEKLDAFRARSGG